MTRNFILPAVLALACLPCEGARATPLDPTACEQLRQELGAIERTGARINLAKGAAWAKANLKPDQLQQIEKLLDTEAQFLFRCPQPKRQFDAATEAVLEHGTGSDPDPDAAKPDASKPDAATKPVPAKKAASKPKPVAAEPAAGDATQPPPAPTAKPKRAAAKPKAADAFVPETAAKSTLAPAQPPSPQ